MRREGGGPRVSEFPPCGERRPDVYMPVFGCDDVAYDNSCVDPCGTGGMVER